MEQKNPDDEESKSTIKQKKKVSKPLLSPQMVNFLVMITAVLGVVGVVIRLLL